ncbi:MAG: Unknown protein [uncultured Sulfurovum sp.]|uniref:Fibronectin type-III domain-containing protein n=1 Tax=uncultured Sulfurovum sp. TaxID=269237 RepID=A0A6S6SRC2_9BACT|nr:MAG: Unknown protein [uncultured Sulfurovum sp.]
MKQLYLALFLLSSSSLSAQVYEDAEDGSTQRWIISDNKPAKASIKNISLNDNKVIKLSGKRTKNEYMLGGINSENGWNDLDNDSLKWDMKFSEYFAIYIPIETENGIRYLIYTAKNKSTGLRGKYIHIGLGKKLKNGEMHTIKRNIQEDLQRFDRSNELIGINGFIVRGSGEIDNVETSASSESNNNIANNTNLILQSFSANNIKSTQAEIRILGQNIASYQVEYGENENLGLFSEKVEGITQNNASQILFTSLNDLKAKQQYFFKVQLFDSENQQILSETKTFTTKEAVQDNAINLSLTSSTIQNITAKTVKLGFQFNEPIKSFQIKYGTTENLDKETRKKENIQVQSLSESIASLQPNTKYFYQVLASDNTNNNFVSPLQEFTTQNANVEEVNDPTFRIESLIIFTIDSLEAQTIATLYGAETAELQYSEEATFQNVLTAESLLTNRGLKQSLFSKLTGLKANTKYFYRVRAVNDEQKEIFSETKTFTSRK